MVINTKSHRAILKADKITALICRGVAKDKKCYIQGMSEKIRDGLST
jgi:hypothetical protein